MEGNGNNPEIKVVTPAAQRVRASGPILILAVLFVVGAFLTWYFTWFGRNLSDADISQYLVDEKHPRRVQHALLQIQHRIETGDASAKQWYPQVINLASHSETEFRLTVAWLMGFDNKSSEFHQALLKLVNDSQPIVRRNAALALVRFNDRAGRQELLAVLRPYELKSPAGGTVGSILPAGSDVGRGTLVGRINEPTGRLVEVRSPLPGRIDRVLSAVGSNVNPDTTLLTLISDEDSIWEVLRGLALIGQPEDLQLIDSYAEAATQPNRIKQQAVATVGAIKRRAEQNGQN
ncbi:MAG TPA: HEAT repeat domain-containing protein [Pyrinomonadaceae bacterium]|nr:HEAT repeat domain-containing protein [Pyrinomonadaceae bacterium]